MFRAIMSQQQQQQHMSAGCQGNQAQLYHQLSPHSVASTLAQIGVDPGYYSDSECSSNSSDKVAEEGNVSPQQVKLTRIPEQQIQQQPNTNYSCFNDYFGFNELVKPLPLRYPDTLLIGNQTPTLDCPSSAGWKDGWKAVESPVKDNAVSEGAESVEDSQLYTPATSPPSSSTTPPSTVASTVKKGNSKRSKAQVCVFCRNNGEDESVYSTHALKSPDGKVTCPILFAYECPICRASGENAHTLKYCPRNPNGQGHLQPQGSNTGSANNNNNNTYQGYTGSSNMGYGANNTRSGGASSGNNFNANLMQTMLQMTQMPNGGGNIHPALAQLNFNMAAMLYQQQLQQNQQEPQQPTNPFAEWVQQQQQQQQYGGENKNYTPQQTYNAQSNYNTPSPTYTNNYNTPNYTPNNYPNEMYPQQQQQQDHYDVDNNLSQLFGKASIDDFFQNYAR